MISRKGKRKKGLEAETSRAIRSTQHVYTVAVPMTRMLQSANQAFLPGSPTTLDNAWEGFYPPCFAWPSHA